MPAPRKPVVQIKGDLSALRKALFRFPPHLADEAKLNFEQSALALKSVMQKRSSEGPLYKRTGRLRRSWSANVGGTRLGDITGVVGSFASYSVHHELGTTLRAKLEQWIWIPTAENMKANRTAKVSPTEARKKIQAGAWRYSQRARGTDDRNLFGNKALVLNEQNVPMFILTKQVTIPPRLAFMKTAETFEQRVIERLMKGADDYWRDVPIHA